MGNQQERRERIAEQVLAGMVASSHMDLAQMSMEDLAGVAVRAADALIAELDRTAPSNSPDAPEGWVIWEDLDDLALPVLDRYDWHKRDSRCVEPFGSAEDARYALSQMDGSGLRVRKWPLDPAEDKEVQS